METRVSGRVWVFGDDVDTDVMAPWNTLDLPWEERRQSVLKIRPEFASGVKPGDLVVGGRNWGCGSSREHAPENLKRLGVRGVVAESFGRIYFRNCVAIAFPNLACPGIRAACQDGDEIAFDLRSGEVQNLTRALTLHGTPYTEDMLAILERGGLMGVLRQRFGRDGEASA